MAVDVVVPVAHRSEGGGGATPVFPISSALVPASAAAIGIAASAYAVSTLLSYYATFAVSLVCFARAVWPDRIDAALAHARHGASLARADLEADLRHLRDAAARAHPDAMTAAEGCAHRARAAVAGWRRSAEARWSEHREAACAARFVLRLAALVTRLAATVLFDAACDEARAWAPSVLGYLRRVADGIRGSPSSSPSSCNNKGEDEEDVADAGFVLKDVVCLVGAGFYLLFTMHLLFSSRAATGMQFCAVCFAATCGLTMVIADWIDPPDDDADETGTAAAAADEDTRPEGDADAAGEASRDEELEVRESWRFLWVLVLITYCVNAFLLHVTLGPQPTTLAILALCNFEVLKVGRQVQLTPDDHGEGAAAEGVVEGAVDKWRRGAMVVYAACSVKTFVVYLVLDCHLAALGFLWLFVMADLLLPEEDNLSDFDASGEEDDEDGEESAAGFEGNVSGVDEGEVDEEAREEEHSSTSSSESEDEDESYAHCDEDEEENYAHCDSSSEDEEESSVHCDSSLEDHEIVDEEQRHEGPDYGSGGSSDDSWDLVDVDDPEMPAKANRVASRNSRRLFSWKKHAA